VNTEEAAGAVGGAGTGAARGGGGGNGSATAVEGCRVTQAVKSGFTAREEGKRGGQSNA